MADLRVVELPVGHLRNIPEMLRRIADEIQQGTITTPAYMLLIGVHAGDKTEIDLYGIGDTPNDYGLLGTIEFAKHHLLRLGGDG